MRRRKNKAQKAKRLPQDRRILLKNAKNAKAYGFVYRQDGANELSVTYSNTSRRICKE